MIIFRGVTIRPVGVSPVGFLFAEFDLDIEFFQGVSAAQPLAAGQRSGVWG